jgi:hypothetical protein
MANRMVVLLFLILSGGCREGGNKNKEVPVRTLSLSEVAVRFDGRVRTGWDVTNFGPQGPVYVSGDAIILGMGDGCTGITWRGEFPQNNYEVTLNAKKVAGNDFFCGMTFPVGADPCTFIVGGWGGGTVGLSSIDGLDAFHNNTKQNMLFEKDRWYHIRLIVTGGKIEGWIDNTRVVNFDIGKHKLSIRPEVELSRPFGIASWNTTAAIKDVQVLTIK